MLAQILGPDIFIAGLVGIAILGVPIWAIVDMVGRPESAFTAVGSSKTTWIPLVAVFTALCGVVGFVLALYYLLALRPKLVAVA